MSSTERLHHRIDMKQDDNENLLYHANREEKNTKTFNSNYNRQNKTFANMFDEVESNDDEEKEPRTKIQRSEEHDSSSPNVALHVGRGLLQQMHQSITSRNTHPISESSSSTTLSSITHQQEQQQQQQQLKLNQMHILPQQEEEKEMEVVDVYVPLSTGGFLNNADAMDSVVGMKVGDVVCLRECDYNSAKSKETDSAWHTRETCEDETLKSTGTEKNEHASPTSRIIPSASSFTNSSTSNDASSETVYTSIASAPLRHFRSETTLSTREKEYGIEPTVAMMQQMAQITRLDKRRREAEICFVDDRRQKMSLFNLRPAGFVERELFAQWRQNPSSRPVPVIHATSNEKISIESSSARVLNVTENTKNEGSSNTKGESDSASSFSPNKETETLPWWVIPQLIVRVITRAVGFEEWYGQKCVVLSVVRREGRIRLQQYQDNNNSNNTNKRTKESCATHHGSLPIVEIIGQDAIETVLPKRGERGMVVLGEHRGELVQLTTRGKNDSGEVCSVNVILLRSQEAVTLAPHEVCKLASH